MDDVDPIIADVKKEITDVAPPPDGPRSATT